MKAPIAAAATIGVFLLADANPSAIGRSHRSELAPAVTQGELNARKQVGRS